MLSSLDLTSLIEALLSVRGAVFVAGKAALVTAAYLGYSFGVSFFGEDTLELPEFVQENSFQEDVKGQGKPLTAYSSIAARNIFGPGKKKAEEVSNEPQLSELKLRLVGTNISQDSKSPFAIVENAKKEQDVFDVGESIFGQAKLVEVFPNKINIEYRGAIETLVLDENFSSGSGEISGNSDGTSFSVPEAELNENLENLPRLLSQARAVPYFRDGESIGMRLFAIRRDSLYQKLGLKNGDILLSVNGNSLSDPTQALKLFEQLKTERSISVDVERGGVEKKINYSIE